MYIRVRVCRVIPLNRYKATMAKKYDSESEEPLIKVKKRGFLGSKDVKKIIKIVKNVNKSNIRHPIAKPCDVFLFIMIVLCLTLSNISVHVSHRVRSYTNQNSLFSWSTPQIFILGVTLVSLCISVWYCTVGWRIEEKREMDQLRKNFTKVMENFQDKYAGKED